MNDNPFKSPQATENPYLADSLERDAPALQIDGDCLVVRSGTVLPHRCVKTNVPTTLSDERTKKLYWASPWIALLILLNLIILLIVYFVVRKSCDLTFSESPSSRGKRRKRTLLAVLASIFLFVVMLVAIMANSGVGMGLSIAGLLAALVAILVVSRS
ncbi:hypothetical protein N9N28_12930, partial [Rubripirellula amarantea]|nr:hypothetical protein [Rubripirellula amarantea]